jgi:hypothetical protein
MRRDTDGTSPYPVSVFLSAVVLAIFGLAILMVLGTAVYGIVLAVGSGLASLVSDARALLGSTTGSARVGVTDTHPDIVTSQAGSRPEPPELSTEAMWHRMQGTSKKSRRRGITS